nr:hypothetical protein GCM10025732_30160 [Glycomyces mayteni]
MDEVEGEQRQQRQDEQRQIRGVAVEQKDRDDGGTRREQELRFEHEHPVDEGGAARKGPRPISSAETPWSGP